MRLIGPMVHTGQFLRELAWRAFGDENRRWGPYGRKSSAVETHILTPSTDTRETTGWLEWRGYRAAVITSAFSKPGILFGRKNEPVVLAQVGDVLVWDGEKVFIQ